MQMNVRHHRRAFEGSDVPVSKAKWTQHSLHKIRIFAMKTRDNQPNVDVSTTFVLATAFSCTTYTVFRLYILVEDVIAFRGLPNHGACGPCSAARPGDTASHPSSCHTCFDTDMPRRRLLTQE